MAKKQTQQKEVGKNVSYREEGNKLIIEIDKSVKPEPSNSGKTMILASTQGNKMMGDVFVGLNVYRYAQKK